MSAFDRSWTGVGLPSLSMGGVASATPISSVSLPPDIDPAPDPDPALEATEALFGVTAVVVYISVDTSEPDGGEEEGKANKSRLGRRWLFGMSTCPNSK